MRDGFWREGAPPDEDSSILEFLLISALFLFWEICLIRWISTEIRLFAYYKNLPLLGAYLGFGVGLLTVHKQRGWLSSAVLLLCGLAAIVVLYPVSPLRIDHAPAFFQEFTWTEQLASTGVTLKFYGVILLIFALIAAAFVPWGRRIGHYFEHLRTIPAYSMNILANLGGIALFSLLSVLGAPPVTWVLVGLVPLAFVSRGALRRHPLAAGAAALVVLLTGAQYLSERGETTWSPYYKITVEPPGEEASPHHTLKVNHDYHQRMLDLRPEAVAADRAGLAHWSLAYSLPYKVGTPGRVLVIGAGTGNDVAAALRHGARHVTAVEIDPGILSIGRALHPEQPYSSDRVQVVLSDARTYLAAEGAEPYDMIVFGLLDSHTQVSGLTSLRLDNFIYTKESFAQARDRLNPDGGVMVVSFSAGWGETNWTLRRIHRMLEEVFGVPPRLAVTGYDAGVAFLVGPGLEDHPFLESPEFAQLASIAEGAIDPLLLETEPLATDDWPFLYMEYRAIPLEQWVMFALLTAIAAVWVPAVLRGAGSAGGRFSLHFFLLGAAFLLIEVRNLISFSLLFGSTWQVNNLAIGGVLAMILLANLVASRVRELNPYALYAALAAVLVLGLFIGPEDFAELGPGLRAVSASLFLSVPIFCAGLVFIRSFARAVHPAGALGANIIGGICGGLMENASMALGFSALQYLAIGLYLLSFLAMLQEEKPGEAA